MIALGVAWASAGDRAACLAGDLPACERRIVEVGAEVAAEANGWPTGAEELLWLVRRVHCEGCEPHPDAPGRGSVPDGWALRARSSGADGVPWGLFALPGAGVAFAPRLLVDPDGAPRWSLHPWCEATFADTWPPEVVGFAGDRCDQVLRVAVDGSERGRWPRGEAQEVRADADSTWVSLPGQRLARLDGAASPSIPLPSGAAFTGVVEGLPVVATRERSWHGDRPVSGWCGPRANALVCSDRGLLWRVSSDGSRAPIGPVAGEPTPRLPDALPAPDGLREVVARARPGAVVRVTRLGPRGGVGTPIAPVLVETRVADASGLARFARSTDGAGSPPDGIRVNGVPVPDGPGTWGIEVPDVHRSGSASATPQAARCAARGSGPPRTWPRPDRTARPPCSAPAGSGRSRRIAGATGHAGAGR